MVGVKRDYCYKATGFCLIAVLIAVIIYGKSVTAQISCSNYKYGVEIDGPFFGTTLSEKVLEFWCGEAVNLHFYSYLGGNLGWVVGTIQLIIALSSCSLLIIEKLWKKFILACIFTLLQLILGSYEIYLITPLVTKMGGVSIRIEIEVYYVTVRSCIILLYQAAVPFLLALLA